MMVLYKYGANASCSKSIICTEYSPSESYDCSFSFFNVQLLINRSDVQNNRDLVLRTNSFRLVRRNVVCKNGPAKNNNAISRYFSHSSR